MDLITRLEKELKLVWARVWQARTDEERRMYRSKAIAIYQQIKAQKRMIQAMDA
jgi:hypothetical protein